MRWSKKSEHKNLLNLCSDESKDKAQKPGGRRRYSDGGSQNASKEFRALLTRLDCLQSMTRMDNHYDNAFMKSLFSRFKAELLPDGRMFRDFDQAHAAIFDYISVLQPQTPAFVVGLSSSGYL